MMQCVIDTMVIGIPLLERLVRLPPFRFAPGELFFQPRKLRLGFLLLPASFRQGRFAPTQTLLNLCALRLHVLVQRDNFLVECGGCLFVMLHHRAEYLARPIEFIAHPVEFAHRLGADAGRLDQQAQCLISLLRPFENSAMDIETLLRNDIVPEISRQERVDRDLHRRRPARE